MDRYVKELEESRQGAGDGMVVCIGDNSRRADVYWTGDGGCWVIVDRSDLARLKAQSADEIALLKLDPDVASGPDMDELALASDLEGDALWLVNAEHVAKLSSYGDALTVLWRSEGNQAGGGATRASRLAVKRIAPS